VFPLDFPSKCECDPIIDLIFLTARLKMGFHGKKVTLERTARAHLLRLPEGPFLFPVLPFNHSTFTLSESMHRLATPVMEHDHSKRKKEHREVEVV
jgi:hypothetical protein